jgi:citrate lyase synthetase
MQIYSNNSLIAAGSVRENVVRMVTTSSAKITPLALEKRLFEK